MPVTLGTPIIGQSEQTQALLALVRTLAASTSAVLITGESGTGKELVAQALHTHSARHAAHFVPLNCGAVPRDLLESELFGHCKGAFTGAISDRVGRFELANGGTLFLDEIGDLPLDMQVKLLRVLQDKVIHPVGSMRTVPVDVRIIAATHRNLEQEVSEGRFREDLYYRLNVLPCHTTPLRERPDDISDLLDFYAQRHTRAGQSPIRYTPALRAALLRYSWPGNVRELSNLVERFTTLFPGKTVDLRLMPQKMLPRGLQAKEPGASVFTDLTVQDLHPPVSPPEVPAHPTIMGCAEDVPRPAENEPHAVEEIVCMAQGMVSLPAEGVPLKQHLVHIERSLIEQALERCNGNVSQTARLLHLQRTTLIEKINKYALRAH